MRRLLFFVQLMVLQLGAFGQDLNVSLLSIGYHNSNDAENPVRICVNFRTDYADVQDLTVVLKFANNVTYNAVIKDFDSDGNISYSFCSKFGEVSNFDIYFRDGLGNRSKIFNITAIPEERKIREFN